MSDEGKRMREEFKKIVFPKLVELGFVPRGLHFQRKRDVLDLVELQYGKYGGQFIFEFGSVARGDLHTSWGDIIPEASITVAHVRPTCRARLEQRPQSDDNLFQGSMFGGFGEDRSKYEALACQVASLLPQIDAWLRAGALGSHVRSVGMD